MAEENQFKIKIDLVQGIFEAEGNEQFVKENLQNFKEIIAKKEITTKKEMVNSDNKNTQSNPKVRKFSKSNTFSIIKDLNLKPKDKKTLRDFYQEKSPLSNIESNAVFVYYLEKVLNLTGITIDHIFSCYKEVNLRTPMNLRQSIFDTASSRYGYLDTSNMQDIKVIVRGENLVEHDLPRSKKEK